MNTKFIFVTGGVVSSLGKGITAAALGRLLKERGLKVSIQKFDPYINVDPGTMSPYQHGEVYITDDGAETDLDLGHYERFIDESLTQAANVTSGRVYKTVIDRERRGEYLGATIQVIPHITNEIKKNILAVSRTDNPPDIVITEIGGTVGDIESLPFLEAIRQMRDEVGEENCLYIHVTLMPYLESAGEQKTKPTQHSVKELNGIGIHPDILVCRSQMPISQSAREKLSMFCNLPTDQVFQNLTARSIYEVPLLLNEEGLDEKVCELLHIPKMEYDLSEWRNMVEKLINASNVLKVGLVGKYVELHDAYISVVESLIHGGIESGTKIDIKWIHAERLNESNVEEELSDCDAIIVPGGFGERGTTGKMLAITYARTHKVPFLGMCLGMQLAVIEFARNVLNWRDANSTEMDPNTNYPVIDLIKEQNLHNLGGTMRLGKYACVIQPDTLAHRIYNADRIEERHRHRYELNHKFINDFVKAGLIISAFSDDASRTAEIVEIEDHPFFIASQFHPELKSRPNKPHPLFKAFVEAGVKHKENR